MFHVDRASHPAPACLSDERSEPGRRALFDLFSLDRGVAAQRSFRMSSVYVEDNELHSAVTRLFRGRCAFCETEDELRPYRYRPSEEAGPSQAAPPQDRFSASLAFSRAVVLIDEIEAHLHPRWKMRIVTALREALPNVTFIMTTHDPLCLRGLRAGEVMVFRRIESRAPDSLPVVVEQLEDLPDVGSLSRRGALREPRQDVDRRLPSRTRTGHHLTSSDFVFGALGIPGQCLQISLLDVARAVVRGGQARCRLGPAAALLSTDGSQPAPFPPTSLSVASAISPFFNLAIPPASSGLTASVTASSTLAASGPHGVIPELLSSRAPRGSP